MLSKYRLLLLVFLNILFIDEEENIGVDREKEILVANSFCPHNSEAASVFCSDQFLKHLFALIGGCNSEKILMSW